MPGLKADTILLKQMFKAAKVLIYRGLFFSCHGNTKTLNSTKLLSEFFASGFLWRYLCILCTRLFLLFLITLLHLPQVFSQSCNADFSFVVTGCNAVSFVPDTLNPTFTYTWDFGDTNTSNEQNPTHNYFSFGAGTADFNVSLTVDGPDCNESTSAETVTIDQVPDPSVEDASGQGFINCTSGFLNVLNASSTAATNTNYTIQWGDNSPDFNASNFISQPHVFTTPGQYDIIIAVTGSNNCVSVDTVSFIFSATPNIGAALASNSPICLPGSVPIQIVGVQNNTPNTIYIIQANDGSDSLVFSHPPPATFDLFLDSTACGTTSIINNNTFNNAFQVSITAQTGCPNQSASAAVGPIRTINSPQADFEINPDTVGCVGDVFQFENRSMDGLFYDANSNMCLSNMGVIWSVFPNNGYSITNGSLMDSVGFSAIFNSAGTYTIQLIVENNIFNTPSDYDPFCVGDTIQKTICILPEPDASFSINENSGCFPLVVNTNNMSNTLATCAEASYTWEAVFVESECGNMGFATFINGTSQNDVDVEVQFDSSGLYELRLIVDNECGIDTMIREISVSASPVTQINSIPDTCFYGPISIQPSIAATAGCYATPAYNWSFPGSDTATFAGENPPAITYNMPGIYTVLLSTTNDCGTSTTSETFEIFPLPEVPNISHNSPLCVGGAIQFTNPNPGDFLYEWSGPDDFSSINSAPSIMDVSLDNAGTYSLTITDPNTNCINTASYEIEVTLNAPLNVLPNPAELCIGQSITLTATGATNYVWSPETYLNTTSGSTVVVTPTEIGTFEYIVMGVDNILCNGADTVSVIVHPLPTVNAGEDQVVCVNTDTQLTGSPSPGEGIDAYWTGPNVSNSGVFNAPNPGTYSLTYHFQNGNLCEDSSSVNICVIPEPLAGFTINENFGCNNLNVQTTNISNTIGSCEIAEYNWSITFYGADCHTGTGMWNFINSNAISESPEFSFTQSGVYEIQLTVTNQCGVSIASETITIGTTPEVSIDSIEDACEMLVINPTFEEFACNAPITAYEWTFSGGIPSTFNGSIPPSISYNQPGDYSIWLTVTNTCGTFTDTESFRILEGPGIDINLSNDFACVGELLTVANNSTGDDLQYEWMVSGPGTVNISDPMAGEPAFTFPDTGLYVITVEISNPVCSGLGWTTEVLISQAPSVNLDPIPDFCETATFTPGATFSDHSRIDSVRWIFPAQANISTSTDFDPGQLTINAPGDYTIQVLVYNGCGADSSIQSFRILEGPMIDVALDTTFACVGELLTVANNSTGDDLQYEWMVSGPGTVNISDPMAGEPAFTFPDTGLYVITVEISNPVCSGLSWTTEVLISQAPSVNLNPIPDFCETATFTPGATFSDHSRIDSVRWIFPAQANISTSTDFDPGQLTINAPGDYTIQVLVYNGCGADSSIQSFRILEGPMIDVALDTTFACVGELLTVANNSTGDDLQYEWMVSGPGTVNISDPMAGEPAFTFPDTGLYVITLEISNPVCSGLSWTTEVLISQAPSVNLNPIPDFCETATFTPGATFSDHNRIDSLRWIFPAQANIATSIDFDPGQITINDPGEYTVQVFVYNGCGVDSSSQSFRILEGPMIDVALDTTFACVGEVIMVANNSTGDDLQYEWMVSGPGTVNISDPMSGEPVFTFPDTGLYVITLEIGNPVCSGLSWTTEVLISQAPSVNLDPIPDFCETATFTPGATFSDHNRIDSLRWIFPAQANISTSTDFNPGQITINDPGEYTVQVFVYNGCGVDFSSQSFRILEGPMIDVALDTTFACVGEVLMVANNSTGDDLQYEWMVSGPGTVNISDPMSGEPVFTFPDSGLYVITVEISNPVCSGLSWTTEVLISQAPNVNLNPIPDFCETATFTPGATFSDHNRIDSVRWIFPAQANIATSTDFDPGQITINDPGDYTIQVLVYNGCGVDSSSQSFRILEGPMIDVALDTTFACVGEVLTVANNSTGDDLQYEWMVSGPGTVNISDPMAGEPVFTFPDTGLYVITVEISNPVCSGLSWTTEVLISQAPNVNLNPIPDFCETATFTPGATFSDHNRIDSVRWIFPAQANIATSTDFDPGQITINDPGDYTIQVLVYNGCGADSSSQSFRILEGPMIDIALDTTFACVGEVLTVTNNSTGDDLQYEWMVSGPGTVNISDPMSGEPVFTFPDTGLYVITLEISNPVCSGLSWTTEVLISQASNVNLNPIPDFCETATFTPGATFSDHNRIDSVRWIFPAQANISTSTDFDPGQITINDPGDYTIQVLVYNGCGADSSSQSFRILEGPMIDVALDRTFACVGEVLTVTNNSTGDDLQYEWMVSGPGTVNISDPMAGEPAFTFPDTGLYVITVEISNPVCSGLTWTAEVLVSQAPTVNLSPIPDFCETATFTPSAIYSDINRIDSVRWLFPAEANISTSTGFDPGQITINMPGEYTIQVLVYNGCGADSSSQSFRVLEGPMIDVALDTTFACVGDMITVENNSTGDDLQYEWMVSGPGTVNISDPMAGEPAFTFPDTGLYVITVEISNPVCSGLSWTTEVLISQAPSVNLDPIPDFCETATFTPGATFSDHSRIDSVRWIFPAQANISTSTDFDPGHITINDPGDYTIQVLVYNGCGIDSSSQSFRVLEGPMIDVALDTTFACVGDMITVENNSTGDDLEYDWLVSGPGMVNISDPMAGEPTLTFPDTGLYVITLEISNPVCDGISWMTEVLVSEPPSVDLEPIDDFCDQAIIIPNPVFSDTHRIDSIRWLFPGGLPPTSISFDPGGIAYDNAGNYMISLIAYNGCGSDTVSQSFSVFEPIMVAAQLSDNFSCELPYTVEATNQSSGDSLHYEWSVSGPFAENVLFDPNLRDPTFTFQDTGIYILSLAVFNDICGEVSWEDTVQIMTTPEVALSGVDNFCEEVSLTPIVDYGISRIDSVLWSFPGGTPSSSTDLLPSGISYSGAGTFTYSVTAYNTCGMTTMDDTFVIDTIPIIELGPTDTICITDGLFQVAEAMPTGGEWRDSLGRPDVVTPTGLFDPVAAGGGVNTIEYVFRAGACEISAFKHIFVVDLSEVEGGPNVSTCISDTLVILNGGLPEGGWYVGPGVFDSVGLFNPSSLVAGDYVIAYNYRLPGTDCVGTDEFIISVHPLPVPIINVTDSICVDVPVQLGNNSIDGATFEWQIGDGAVYSSISPMHTFTDTGFFTINLIAISEFACVDSTSTEIFVSGPPEARFTMDTTMGCAVLPITFSNESIGFQYVNYNWDFGNGMSSTADQPGIIEYEQGLRDTTYYITLTATNHCGQDQMLDSVLVLPLPLAFIDVSQDQGCSPLEVEFNNLTEGLPDAFLWDLGLGGQFLSDSIPPPQVYLAPDSVNVLYQVTFYAFNECGADTATQEILVQPNFIRAFFSVEENVGCEPFTVDFNNSTSPDSVIVYDWFFGDGDTSTEEDPSYTFYAQGDTTTIYEVTLVANNGCASDSISIPITVHPAPRVSFNPPPVTCAKDTVFFSNTSIEVAGSMWDFGDGTLSHETNPGHLYANPGDYQVTLTVFAIGTGCPNTYSEIITIRDIPSPNLSVSPLFGCPPLTVNLSNESSNAMFYNWDFGDGNSTVGPNPGTHIYAESGVFDIRLTATDEFGCSNDTIFSSVQVYPVPIAEFMPELDEPCGVPVTICMENSSQGGFAFNWNLGNGESSAETNPCTIFETPGQYTVSLTATNEFMCTSTTSQLLTVYGEPKATFSLSDTLICTNDEVQFINESSNATFAEWIFSDGVITTDWDPVRVFADTGSYDVTLIVGNESGCTDTLRLENFWQVFPTPIAAFDFDELDNELPTTIEFTDHSSDDATSFWWDFDDGQFSNEPNPVHRFLSSFDKLVTHAVANTYGCTDTVTAWIDLDTLGGLFIPNIFEPEDLSQFEKNVFQPKGIGLAKYHIAVFARNGQLVWESTSLNEEGMPDEAWDGTFRGELMQPGAYVWKVFIAQFLNGTYWDGMPDEKQVPRRSGFVYLVR